MIPARYRRLWSRRLRRRPLLVPALAATLALDAALATSRLGGAGYPGRAALAMAVAGLLVGQLGLLGLWVALGRRGRAARALAATVAGATIAAVLAGANLGEFRTMITYAACALGGAAAMTLTAAALARAVGDAIGGCTALRPRGRIRFGVGLVLVWTTLVAVVTFAAPRLDRSVLLDSDFVGVVLLEAMLPVAVLAATLVAQHTSLRARMMLLCAAPVGLALLAAGDLLADRVLPAEAADLVVHYSTQAATIGAWLVVLAVRPRSAAAAAQLCGCPPAAPCAASPPTGQLLAAAESMRIDVRV